MPATGADAGVADSVTSEREAVIALALSPRVGPVAHAELVERHGSAAAAFAVRVSGRVERDDLIRRAREVVSAAAAAGARVLTRGDGLPERLRELADPPPFLFALGNPATLDAPVAAIVGTRASSEYGERVTRELASSLARAGACVVSGLARGIDATAHGAALAVGGRTAAVLGTGIDVPYPAAHRALHGRVAARGLVLSEHGRGEPATAGSFPRRNRIIAALADVTIVVEAGRRSGALITAGVALDLGRTVAAVPGRIDDASSAGSNELLRDGATVIASVDDALALLSLTPVARRVNVPVDGDARVLWDALATPAPDVDTLASRSRLPAHACMVALTELELAGVVECAMSGEVRRR